MILTLQDKESVRFSGVHIDHIAGGRTGSILILLAKAALNNPPFLILKPLRPGHSTVAVDPARPIL